MKRIALTAVGLPKLHLSVPQVGNLIGSRRRRSQGTVELHPALVLENGFCLLKEDGGRLLLE